jgi:hypothetical protein
MKAGVETNSASGSPQASEAMMHILMTMRKGGQKMVGEQQETIENIPNALRELNDVIRYLEDKNRKFEASSMLAGKDLSRAPFSENWTPHALNCSRFMRRERIL